MTDRNGAPWTPPQDKCLRRLAAIGAAKDDIAGILQRTKCAIESRAKLLRVGFRRHGGAGRYRCWVRAEEAQLCQLAGAGVTKQLIASKLQRSARAIELRARRLKVHVAWLRRPRKSSDWTSERIAKAKAWWLAGKSGSWIATKLDSGITKNAVIGKMYRLKCRRPRPPSKEKVNGARPASPSRRQQPGKFTLPLMWGARDWRRPRKPPMALPARCSADVGRVSHQALGARHCRWVVGEVGDAVIRGEPLYCGLEHLPGLPYCAEHCQRAYVQISEAPHQVFWGEEPQKKTACGWGETARR